MSGCNNTGLGANHGEWLVVHCTYAGLYAKEGEEDVWHDVFEGHGVHKHLAVHVQPANIQSRVLAGPYTVARVNIRDAGCSLFTFHYDHKSQNG